jgi:hypothetical protein
MPASPWRTFGSLEPDRDYVALLSYLPLKSYWRIPVFFFYTAQVTKQLASAEDMLGYLVLARPLSKQFWTLSAWKDDAALRTFVQHPPHVRIMNALSPHMGETRFARWMVTRSQLPLGWDGALSRFSLWRNSLQAPASSKNTIESMPMTISLRSAWNPTFSRTRIEARFSG